MKKLYGTALKTSILNTKARLMAAIEDRQNRINNCETDMDDCFISERMERNGLVECDKQLEILSNDGLMDYDAIFDKDGNEIWVHWVNTRYGGAYVGRGIFASSIKALLRKTGWTMKTIQVPCWTKSVCHGSGLCGAFNSTIEIVRWHTNMVTGEYVGYPK